MAKGRPDQLEETRRVMGALLRMPPKAHEDMKLNKPSGKKRASPKRKKAKRDG